MRRYVVVLALVATACTGDPAPKPDPEPIRRGGTLRLLGAGDVDHLDTASGHTPHALMLFRAVSRQLVSYSAGGTTPAADAAEERDSYVSDEGLTYTFTVKQGVRFDARAGSRQVTAKDFEVGLERLCDPHQPSEGRVYFAGTIKGFREFCDGFARAVDASKDDAVRTAQVRRYVEDHAIEGIRTDGRTITFELTAPAGDFLDLLALPYASPVAPEIALAHVADSPGFRQSFVSSGPYSIASYRPDKSLRLVRNPAWDQATDPLRGAYVDAIEIAMGHDTEPVQEAIEAGRADLSWDTTVPPERLAGLQGDPRLYANPDGCLSYLVMRTDRAPFDDERVRQGVNWALDRSAVAAIDGGTPAYGILQPPLHDHGGPQDYRTAGDRGDRERARELLAGNPAVRARLLHRNNETRARVAEAHRSALQDAGIGVTLKPVTGTTHFVSDTSDEWDLVLNSWCPDALSPRAMFAPPFDTRARLVRLLTPSGWKDATTDALLAAQRWQELDRHVMDKAVWAPVTTGRCTTSAATA